MECAPRFGVATPDAVSVSVGSNCVMSPSMLTSASIITMDASIPKRQSRVRGAQFGESPHQAVLRSIP
jgi:hypothetical protein